MTTIEVHTDKGAKPVDATLFGRFAVHETVGNYGTWTVTHINSGGAVVWLHSYLRAAKVAALANKAWKSPNDLGIEDVQQETEIYKVFCSIVKPIAAKYRY